MNGLQDSALKCVRKHNITDTLSVQSSFQESRQPHFHSAHSNFNLKGPVPQHAIYQPF